MSPNKKSLFKNIFTTNVVGCGCNKSKPADVYQPQPKPSVIIDQNSTDLCHSSPSCWERCEDHSPNSFSFIVGTSPQCSDQSDPMSKISQSLAVEKDSDDPYQDFRHSMLQMILEKDLHGKDDLQDLLNCFLQLNSPTHHETIVKAFTDIWNEGLIVPHRSKLPQGSRDA